MCGLRAGNRLFDMMKDAMIKGERIEIRGLGVFSVRSRKAKTVRNPQSGQLLQVPPQRGPYFKMALEIKKGLLKHDDV